MSNPNQIYANCPYCITRKGKADTKNHLGINVKKGVYHCFSCGAAGKFTNLKEIIGQDTDAEGEYVDPLELLLPKAKDKISLDMDVFSRLPSIEKDALAYVYLQTRGYDPEYIIREHHVRVGKEFKKPDGTLSKIWIGRVIFPLFKDGKPIFAVGRSYIGREPKYLNSYGDKQGSLFGIERAIPGEPLILCEGVISALAAEKYTGLRAVAGLGKEVTDGQITTMKMMTNKLIVSIDGDVEDRVKNRLIERVLLQGFQVEYVSLPTDKERKDPDCLKGEYLDFFSSRKKITSILDLFLMKSTISG